MKPSDSLIRFIEEKAPGVFCIVCLLESFASVMKSHPDRESFSQKDIDHTFASFVNGAIHVSEFSHVAEEIPPLSEMN